MNEEQEILVNEEISAVTGGWPRSAPETAAGSNPGCFLDLSSSHEPHTLYSESGPSLPCLAIFQFVIL